MKNNLAEPEYDFLSKQPTEVIDETYKVRKTGEKNRKYTADYGQGSLDFTIYCTICDSVWSVNERHETVGN